MMKERMKKLKIYTIVCFMVLVCTAGYIFCVAAYAPAIDNPSRKRPPLQPVAIDTTYSFINYDTNHIYIGPDSTIINKFLCKWHQITTTGQGNINIVHIGGSHVQGGTFPHRIRRNLLSFYPDLVASRGLLFPYSVGRKCNNPYDYKVSKSRYLDLTRNVYKEPQHRLGLCGIAVTARDSAATIGIALNEPAFDFSTSQIILLGESPNGVIPYLMCGKGKLAPLRVDTVQHRYIYNLAVPTDSFRIIMPCDSGQSFTLTGVFMRNHRPGITYHSIGVNGASVPDYLKCPDLVSDLRMVQPDLVIFGIGINDAFGSNFDTVIFRRNYLRLIDSIRTVNPDCAFIFITNNDCYRRVKKRTYAAHPNGPLARDVFYRLANETSGAVWDQFEIMGGLKSMNQWRIAGLAQPDRVHFTRSGYELIGDLFTNAFIELLLRADKVCELQPPATSRQSNKSTPISKSSKSKPLDSSLNERPTYISY